MKILLLGANGQVGWELQRSLAPLGDLRCADICDTPIKLDLSDKEGLRRWITSERPRWVVNAAAYTAVDQAESRVALAEQVNAEAPGVIASAAAEVGAAVIHYSTDYIFDGSGTHYRDESEPPTPLSVYGRTKWQGEQQLAQGNAQHVILRTSWVYAARGHNFIRTILRLARERETLSIVDDQIGAPTGADLLADITAQAMMQLTHGGGRWGTFHAVAAGQTSWFGLAQHVIRYVRERGTPLALKTDGLLPIPTTQYPTPAPRPLNSRLSTALLQGIFGMQLPPWQIGVDRMLAEVGDRS
jgi:dTDP-4-dehydrorhamnose reductase